MSEASQSLPPAAVVVQHQVADFDTWKAGFDGHEPARRAAGFVGHHINRAQENPNILSVYLGVSDVDAANAFFASDDLKDTMQEFGVVSQPKMMWMTPVRESIVWDRELPSFILSHRVADFDAWLEGYDQASELQKANGIIGQAANRSMDDPSVAIVYHQAESFDILHAFLSLDGLAEAMKEAGVISEPEITFHTGGWAKMY